MYIAVTYSRKPQRLEHYHAYDTRYATYLVDCLAREGLKVSQLKPRHITRPGYQDMEIINDTEENKNITSDTNRIISIQEKSVPTERSLSCGRWETIVEFTRYKNIVCIL
ncbi:MAG: hypothetical protein ACLS5W_11540 [Coprococcus sp.]